MEEVSWNTIVRCVLEEIRIPIDQLNKIMSKSMKGSTLGKNILYLYMKNIKNGLKPDCFRAVRNMIDSLKRNKIIYFFVNYLGKKNLFACLCAWLLWQKGKCMLCRCQSTQKPFMNAGATQTNEMSMDWRRFEQKD